MVLPVVLMLQVELPLQERRFLLVAPRRDGQLLAPGGRVEIGKERQASSLIGRSDRPAGARVRVVAGGVMDGSWLPVLYTTMRVYLEA